MSQKGRKDLRLYCRPATKTIGSPGEKLCPVVMEVERSTIISTVGSHGHTIPIKSYREVRAVVMRVFEGGLSERTSSAALEPSTRRHKAADGPRLSISAPRVYIFDRSVGCGKLFCI